VGTKVQCQKCNQRFNVASDCAGKIFRCKCGEFVTVPKPPKPAALADPDQPIIDDTDLSALLSTAADEEDSIPIARRPAKNAPPAPKE
jgi:hypothetical protein